MVTTLDEQGARAWLKNYGVRNVDKVIDGIDFAQPVYLAWLDVGEKLVQYRRRPSADYPDGQIGGQWFAIGSHDGNLGTVGLGDGLTGRTRHVLEVHWPVRVLESTSKSMDAPDKMPYEDNIGPGGATQVFIPDGGMSSLGAPIS